MRVSARRMIMVVTSELHDYYWSETCLNLKLIWSEIYVQCETVIVVGIYG